MKCFIAADYQFARSHREDCAVTTHVSCLRPGVRIATIECDGSVIPVIGVVHEVAARAADSNLQSSLADKWADGRNITGEDQCAVANLVSIGAISASQSPRKYQCASGIHPEAGLSRLTADDGASPRPCHIAG